jgi:hypothetical protein
MNERNWKRVACEACGGYGIREAFGGGPTDCDSCHGAGKYYAHRNGATAQYPGGPFTGRLDRSYLAMVWASPANPRVERPEKVEPKP